MITRSGALTVDVETTGYPFGHHHYQLRTAQLGDANLAVVFDATNAHTHDTVTIEQQSCPAAARLAPYARSTASSVATNMVNALLAGQSRLLALPELKAAD